MTQYLPPNLLALFAARDPIPYKPPVAKLTHEKKSQPYAGVSQFLSEFEDPKDTPPPTRCETRDERKERKRKERAEQIAYKLEQDLALWDPTNDPSIVTDPFKTLFVARMNYDTSESKLRREMESYGNVKSIRIAHDKQNGKPRGYAFVEFEHERDMHSAYKHADGKKIDGRRILVDIERGRTIKNWRPRRLGGGLGGTRKGGPDVNVKYSGREDSQFNRDEREDSRERDRRRERRRRSRSREKRRRSRSKERKRSKSKERDEDRKRRRSRSRDRKRSRSRDRKRSRRSRSRERKRSRSREKRDRRRNEEGVFNPEDVKHENGEDNGVESGAGDYDYPVKVAVKEEPPEDPNMFTNAYGTGGAVNDVADAYGNPKQEDIEEGEEVQ